MMIGWWVNDRPHEGGSGIGALGGVFVWGSSRGSFTAAAKPHAHHTMAPMQASRRFLRRMFFVFLVRTEPASSRPKPACMKKTRLPTNR